MRRAHPRRSISTVDESFYIESLLAPEHVVDGASQFVRQCGQGLRLAVFLFQPCQVSLPLGVVSEETDPGFREGPLQMRVADFVARRTVDFAGGFFLRFHQPAVGCEILDTRETRNVVNFVKKDQRQNLTDPRNRIEQMKRVGVVLFGMTQDFQLDLVEQIVIEADPLQIEVTLDCTLGSAKRSATPSRLLL